MKYVWIIWYVDQPDGKYIEGVFADKLKAETYLREIKARFPETHYWIQEEGIVQ